MSVVTFDLATVCPRLAVAHRQRRAELVQERAERRHVLRLLQRAEWRVAHRELQLARAGAIGNGRYIDRRIRKLDQARRDLAVVQGWARRIGVAA